MEIKKKILVVDDETINRMILKKILVDEYEVVEAHNGKEALSLMEMIPVSAVLLDLVMPEMNGFEFLRIKNNNPKIASIPVIVITGSVDNETEKEILSLGALDFLSKPYNPYIIKIRLKNLINLVEASNTLSYTTIDQLTGLLTKDYFDHEASAFMQANPHLSYSIIIMNLERFKLVKDIFGTKEGDRLLQYIAKLIKKQNNHYYFAGRVNADIFVALAKQDPYGMHYLLEIQEGLEKYPLDIQLNVKFGIYPVEDPNSDIIIMCDHARLACSSIKGQYGVTVATYDESIRHKMIEEQTIIDNMQKALEEHQFEVYYQPKYDLMTESIAGAEALVRWNHPTFGFMPPNVFIPLFEKNGFITDLDTYVWEQVCRQISIWQRNNEKIVPISVNVSRVDIYNSRLVATLKNLVGKYGIETRDLHLEITETAYTKDSSQLIDIVEKLKKLGFIIEMDDFGSGYSSLTMLSEMPIDILKLDMGFMKKDLERGYSGNIISFIISLAKWLGLSVVAEGVETETQIDLLRNMECNYVQGFYFAKPLPVDKFEELLFNSDVFDPTQHQLVATKNHSSLPKINDNSHKRTMLIVDDVELNRAALSEIFKEEYNTIEAENGEVAYQYVQEHESSIDIVLLDLIMPRMDGFTFIETVQSHHLLENVPIVITSQFGREFEEKALKLGAFDFISKPYNPEFIRTRIANVMSHSDLAELEKVRHFGITSIELKRVVDEMTSGAAVYKYHYDTGAYEVLYMNSRLEEMFGYTYEEYVKLVRENPVVTVAEKDQDRIRNELKEVKEENRDLSIDLNIVTKSKEETYVKILGLRIRKDAQSIVFYCLFRNLSEVQHRSILLEEELTKDYLSGVLNRGVFEDRVKDYFDNERFPHGLFIVMDIDNFKDYNDVLGHVEGDAILASIGRRLSEFFDINAIVGRLGGDEFGVFIKGSFSYEEVQVILEKMHEKMQFKANDLDKSMAVTCSIGAAFYDEINNNFEDLYKCADTTLLYSKRFGKNQIKIYERGLELPAFEMVSSFEWLLEETPMYIMIIRLSDFRILFINNQWAHIFKKEKEQMIGKVCHRICHHRSLPCEDCDSMIIIEKGALESSTRHVCGHNLLIKRKQVNWQGEEAIMMMGVDVDEK